MSDKNFALVQFLAGFSGVDGATSYTEESSASRAATFVGNAQLDTAQSRFPGGASLLLDGTGDYVTFADDAAFTLGTSDFTIELSCRFNVTPGASIFALMAHYNAGGNQRSWVLSYANGTLQFSYSTNGTSTTNVAGAWSATSGTWYDVSVARISTNLRLFVDGELVATHNIATSNLFNSTAALQIGTQSLGTNSMNGWVDEARFTVGAGRYSAAHRRLRGPFNRAKRLGVLGDYFQPTVLTV